MEQVPATPTGKLLREWRGDMKLERASVYASDALGYDISREMVRLYEVSRPEDEMDPSVLAALVVVYGRNIGDLPPRVAARVERVGKLYGTLVLNVGCLDQSTLGHVGQDALVSSGAEGSTRTTGGYLATLAAA